jgi:peptidoglycan/LPS O-acetylase OafA/YrhL
MEYVRLGLLVLHLLGFAALLGGLLAQVRGPDRTITPLVRDGAGTAVVAGVALAGVIVVDADPSGAWFAKVAVKLVVGLAVLVLVMANLRRERISTALWASLVVLTLLDLGVAILWHPTRGTF